jgi:hypothetical protein
MGAPAGAPPPRWTPGKVLKPYILAVPKIFLATQPTQRSGPPNLGGAGRLEAHTQ